MSELSDSELLAELGVEAKQQPVRKYTAREERIIAGFEDICRFYDEHGRVPQHGEGNDVFERLYAVRLDRLRELEDAKELLASLDANWLLKKSASDAQVDSAELADEDLLAELGVVADALDITQLKHVQTRAEKKAAEEVANREKCPDFEQFEPLLEKVAADIASGALETRKFELKSEIQAGRFFVVGGQIAYVADMGETFTTDHGRSDARLRVVFDNGTQSEMLMRSLQRLLNADGDAGRRVVEDDAGPLFSREREEGDQASGTIYVLRSKSDHPLVSEHRDLVHKIGVTDMAVEKRIAGARLQSTFLMADVEIVATYKLSNMNRTKFENLIHRFFADAALDIEVLDRFGKSVKPREWFLVPLQAIDEAVSRIIDGTIVDYRYALDEARLISAN
ncbi:GIY-YIG nuclease family protein [Erythrobacteraceae bacterium WH01K]|nr:GIY-YIG nuclease family protein [Erythrobacteraceae bacterium WH01K]